MPMISKQKVNALPAALRLECAKNEGAVAVVLVLVD
jgi:hypothetical protein